MSTRGAVVVAISLLVLFVSAACASSAFASARWALSSRAAPTNLAPGAEGLLIVGADDLGNAGVRGAAHNVTLTDVLPSGVKVANPQDVNPHWARSGQIQKEKEETWQCAVTEEDQRVTCSTSLNIPAYERLEVEIPVLVTEPEGTVATVQNQLSVSGGEAEGGGTVASEQVTRPLQIDAANVTYGIEPNGFSFRAEDEDGALDMQAGSHPYQLTSTVFFNQTLEEVQRLGQPKKLAPGAPALSKNLTFRLPPGLLGNINAATQCPDTDFAALEGTIGGIRDLCPASSAIGVATVAILVPSTIGYKTIAVPIFNLEPAQGEPARFGFEAEAVPVVIDTTVHTEDDYDVSATVNNATAAAQVLGAQVVFWGNPGEVSHDHSRGWACLREGLMKLEGESCEEPKSRNETPFLTLPTNCDGELSSLVSGEAWTNPGEEAKTLEERFVFENQLGEALSSLEGCAAIPFEPALAIQPRQEDQQASTSASTPSGLDAKVTLDQAGTLSNGMLGDGDVRFASVTLPQGVLLNPAAANGLEACSEAQVGYQGPGEVNPFSPGSPEPLRFSSQQARCPQGSKLGRVRIKTPLLAEELSGSVYLAEQERNPFGSLIALYIVAESEKLGLSVKLAGEGHLNEANGQISTTFANTPQVPFEELQLQLFGGPRGSLSTPTQCGSYTASSSFESWSGATSEAQSDPSFEISSGPGGASCPSGSLPFSPSMQAGSANLQAGAFSSFSLSLEKPDGDQALSGLSLHLPAGVAAELSAVSPCPEAQAAQNQCGPQSLIGHSEASAGLGSEPFTLPGNVYLTGPYEGAPFGLSVVTPAIAGPFDLGDVTVRSKIEVDPHTAQVTIQSDPFPTFVKGIPVQLKDIEVSVDRPDFQYNPTSCEPMKIEGTLKGAEGAGQSLSSPFQVAGCAGLPFKPGVTANTLGKTSKADGASLGLVFKSKTGEAHVAKTILTIPATLPARLTTIQKACVASVFEANPAACPEGSDIGSAIVHTPVLESPLVGPIYLVSHGNAAWPDAELVLQGENIKVILDGQTAIKKGVTTSSFESVPDAPFESVEATLPEGPHSALTTNLPLKDHYSLCGQHLVIPTALTGQNGTAVNENVKLSVKGCAAVKASKTKKLTRHQKLARALNSCRKAGTRARVRAGCERTARRRYGSVKRAHKS